MIPVALITMVEGWLGPRFSKLAKPLLIGVGVLLLIGLAFAAVKIHDHRVVATHDAKQEAATAKADRQADTTAAVQRRADDTRLTQESQELQRSTTNAQTDVDRRLAFQRCLRKQQQARREKTVSPVC